MYYLELVYKDPHTNDNVSVEFHDCTKLDCMYLIEHFHKNYILLKIKWEKE